MKKPELLAPAGNLSKLKTAIQYGADAVYIGGEEFSMRTACDNFSLEEIKQGADFAKKHGKKVYAAVNVIMRNHQLDGLYKFTKEIYDAGVDAVIVSDLGAFDVIRQAAPDMEIHISTQANITNYRTAKMWHDLGAKRIVLARELSKDEITELVKNTPDTLETEMFVHGSMCISYSGRCLLSNYLTGRDANGGACAHPCRWKYYLMEEKRPGEYIPVFENDNGSFFFNSRDLCLIEFIPELVGLGIDSFKIEGRVKSEFYVATTIKAYREEIDRYFENPDKYVFDPKQIEEISKVSHREYTRGFFFGRPHSEGQIYDSSTYIKSYDLCGIVTECDDDGNAVLIQKNKFSVGDKVELMRPHGKNINFEITEMKNQYGELIESAPHGAMEVHLKFPEKVEENSILRKEIQK